MTDARNGGKVEYDEYEEAIMHKRTGKQRQCYQTAVAYVVPLLAQRIVDVLTSTGMWQAGTTARPTTACKTALV